MYKGSRRRLSIARGDMRFGLRFGPHCVCCAVRWANCVRKRVRNAVVEISQNGVYFRRVAPLAQRLEQRPFKSWVVGSNPTGGTTNPRNRNGSKDFFVSTSLAPRVVSHVMHHDSCRKNASYDGSPSSPAMTILARALRSQALRRRRPRRPAAPLPQRAEPCRNRTTGQSLPVHHRTERAPKSWNRCGSRCQRTQRGHERHRNHRRQRARARRDPLVDCSPPTGRQQAESARRHRRGRHHHPCTAVRQHRPRGRARLGELLETYGTYESNGIAFPDVDEIWYVETIGGHHWIARRVPDVYATSPTSLASTTFDLDDAFGDAARRPAAAPTCASSWPSNLDRTMGARRPSRQRPDGTTVALPTRCNPRNAFGTATPKDHSYNTPRAWYM